MAVILKWVFWKNFPNFQKWVWQNACRGKFCRVTIFYNNQIFRSWWNLKYLFKQNNCLSESFACARVCYSHYSILILTNNFNLEITGFRPMRSDSNPYSSLIWYVCLFLFHLCTIYSVVLNKHVYRLGEENADLPKIMLLLENPRNFAKIRYSWVPYFN